MANQIFAIGDSTTKTIEHALNALAMRSEVIANNVANSEVPGFQASQVAFEDSLRSALRSGRLDQVGEPEVFGTGDPSGVNGNNVDLQQEFTEMMKNNLYQDAMIEAFNYKAGLLRSAIQG